MLKPETLTDIEQDSMGLISVLEHFNFRVFPPKVEFTAEELAPALSGSVEGDTVAVAKAMLPTINDIARQKARKIGTLYTDIANGSQDTYLNRGQIGRDETTGEARYGFTKGRPANRQ